MLIPFEGIESELRPNFDGVLAFNSYGPQIGYIQLFRSGVIEAVDTQLLREEGGRFIPARTFEQKIINTTVRCLSLINDLGNTSPIAFHVSLLGVKGYKVRVETWAQNVDTYWYKQQSERFEIDRDDLLLPGLLVSQEDATLSHLS